MSPRYVATGHLVFAHPDGSVFAAAFNLRRLRVTGSPAAILQGVAMTYGSATLHTSDNGSLIYSPATTSRRNVVIVDRQGASRRLFPDIRDFDAPRFSPDGRRVAVGVREGPRGPWDVWLYELDPGTLSRLTFARDAFYPVWTPSGSQVTFSTNRACCAEWFRASSALMLMRVGGGPADTMLLVGAPIVNGSWSADGRELLFTRLDPKTQRDIWVLPLGGQRRAWPYLQTPYDERTPMLSPDGRWVAYTSTESRRDEIYVAAFPAGGNKTQVSNDGGTEPLWARSGRELFYRNGERMMSVSLGITGPTLRVLGRRALFEGEFASNDYHTSYDVSRHGTHFVMVTPAEPSHFIVVQNWLGELRHGKKR